jgi:uncharacterized protein (DUF2235 family)
MSGRKDAPVPRRPRNIVIYSDGTGQRGGLYFDEERTNVYKLYRATRDAPDSAIDPDEQVAFYDPGLGTLPTGDGVLQHPYRKLYNFISQATALGITQNIIDCYAALIRLWRPGDRIFVFGFSRGAYTVRCLASVICMCGIPTTDKGGKPLHRDIASSTRIASRAVKSVYQHVSSPRDEKYVDQRKVLAFAFRQEYRARDPANPDHPNAYPYFIGVFDTVASISNTGSLVILCLAYLAMHVGLAATLALTFAPFEFWFWSGWIAVWTACAITAAYIYTHLKFAWRLPGYYFWDIIHLTTFRQKFYDQYLNPLVKYARHAISIDERRNDFKRVPWGGSQSERQPAPGEIEPFEQLWFAGNHADIGGGYPENECRLSDLALEWMVGEAAHPNLGDRKLIVDSAVLQLKGRMDGMQHDETRSSVFRWAKKTLREAVPNATLHLSVLQRFALAEGVQQYDVTAPYRPEALRNHEAVKHYYTDIPPPHTTCWQRIAAQRDRMIKSLTESLGSLCSRVVSYLYPTNWKAEKAMNPERRQFTPDSFVSCVGLVLLVLCLGAALWIFLFWQIIPWLREGIWHSYPLAAWYVLRTEWVGLQLILDWIFAFPVTLVLVLAGILLFWALGLLSAKLYQWASKGAGKTVTPAQTRA